MPLRGSTECWAGEKIRPDELTGRIGVLSFQRVGEIDLPVPGGQVLLVEQTRSLYLAAPLREDRFGKRDDAVLLALAIPDGAGAVCKIHVLDVQADALHPAQAGAVERLGHQFVDAVQVVQEAADLVPGEDGGETLGPFGRGEEDGINLFVEDFCGKRRALRAWFWVEAETFPSTVRWARKAWIWGVPISAGWRLPWKRRKRRTQST